MTAAERAARVVWHSDVDFKNVHAWSAIKALMADPDLLVDLAVEAGGLERAGLVIDGVEFIPDDLIPATFAVPPSVDVQVVYRRREAT